jgi:hypothetical protein
MLRRVYLRNVDLAIRSCWDGCEIADDHLRWVRVASNKQSAFQLGLQRQQREPPMDAREIVTVRVPCAQVLVESGVKGGCDHTVKLNCHRHGVRVIGWRNVSRVREEDPIEPICGDWIVVDRVKAYLAGSPDPEVAECLRPDVHYDVGVLIRVACVQGLTFHLESTSKAHMQAFAGRGTTIIAAGADHHQVLLVSDKPTLQGH